MEARHAAGPSARWLLSKEDVDTRFPDPACHASTLAETADGLVLAFWGGPDRMSAGQGLWVSHRGADGWGAPSCLDPGAPDLLKCWNPVLYQVPKGPLLLFYKVGPNCSDWLGRRTSSDDGGRTWAPATRLPDGIWGPIRNLPVRLPDGSLLCPSSTERDGWRVHFERTPDLGRTWSRTSSVVDPGRFDAIQPTLLLWPSGRIQALCRTRASTIAQTFSDDGGHTWTPLEATVLPNPNSAVDAVRLRDGRALLVYNASGAVVRTVGGPRTPLSVAVSRDGRAWRLVGHLETDRGEFSYPCVIQASDGRVHVSYTTGIGLRGLRHAVIDPTAIVDGR